MKFRKYTAEDEPQLRQIHAERGYTFEYVPLDSPEFASVWVAEEDGRIVSAVAARKVVEISAFVAQDWGNPAWRLEVMQELQKCGGDDLASQGFTEMVCWSRPEIFGFVRRLTRSLGWIKSAGGICLVRGVHHQ